MEKILLLFREHEYNLLCTRAKSLLKDVQNFVNDVNAINGFKTKAEHLQDMLLYSGDKTLREIVIETGKQISKAGIKSKGVINAAIEADAATFTNLLSSLRRPEAELALLLTIENGEVVINEEVLKQTKERYCHYITTERGKRKKDQYDNFLKAANDFFADNQAFNRFNLDQFFSIDEKKNIVGADLAFDRF